MTPEEAYDRTKILDLLHHAQQDMVDMGKFHSLILAYARPIVAEECARIVESARLRLTPEEAARINPPDSCAQYNRPSVAWRIQGMMSAVAAAIREHGKEKL